MENFVEVSMGKNKMVLLTSLIPAFSPRRRGNVHSMFGKTSGWIRAKRSQNQGVISCYSLSWGKRVRVGVKPTLNTSPNVLFLPSGPFLPQQIFRK
jgi:hypothetical protein